MRKGITVYEVLADISGDGPACDGTRVFRFWHKREADAFASRNTCYGRLCTVHVEENVPPRLAQRWGRA
jgi:hypothetical protein